MAIGVSWFPRIPTAITELLTDAGKSLFPGHNKVAVPEINCQDPGVTVNVSTWGFVLLRTFLSVFLYAPYYLTLSIADSSIWGAHNFSWQQTQGLMQTSLALKTSSSYHHHK